MMKKRISFVNILPIITLLIVVVVFGITSGGTTLTLKNITGVLNQSMTVMIGGVGMVFVLAHGGIDLSIGSLACIAAFVAAKVAMPLGIIPMFLVAIIVGLIGGYIVSIFVTRFKVPSFMVTVAMQTGLRGIANFVVMTSGVIVGTEHLTAFNNFGTKIIVLIIVVAVMWYLFEFTKIGKYAMAIGENELCSAVSGINVRRFKTIGFMLCGAMAGVAGIYMMARTGGVSNMIGKGFELRVIMALFLGSIPVAGGMDSKMFKVIIGALTICSLENGLAVSGITGGLYQLIEGIMLVAICVITDLVKKRATLRDEKMMMAMKEPGVSGS